MGHIVIFPWDIITHLENLWLSPVAALPQEVRRPRLILDLTCIVLNKAVTPQVSHKAVWSKGILKRVIWRILEANPQLVQVYLFKVDLPDAYVCLWVGLKDTPSTDFIIPKRRSEEPQFLGFHLSLLMGFHGSTPFFCVSEETVADMANATIIGRFIEPMYPLEA